MGNITIDERRVQKMQQRLGKATKLITDDNYLPMFRNRQINYAREFDYSIKLAKRKRNPRKYLQLPLFRFLWFLYEKNRVHVNVRAHLQNPE